VLWKQMHICVSRHAQSAVALRFDVHQPEGDEGSTAARGQAALRLGGGRFQALSWLRQRYIPAAQRFILPS